MKKAAILLTSLLIAFVTGCQDHVFEPDPNNFPLPETAWSAGGSGAIVGEGIAVDPQSNVYVTGFFYGTINFGGITLTGATPDLTAFVVKYNAAGEAQWAHKIGGTTRTGGLDIAVDLNGNVYVSGDFGSTANYSDPKVLGEGQLIAAKFSADGTPQWLKAAGNNAGILAWTITTDGSGNVYITGFFTGTAVLGSTTLTAFSSDTKTGGEGDVFITKLNPNGIVQWAQRAGGSQTDRGDNIIVDGNDNVYLTGSVATSANFGGTTQLTAGGYFIARYTPNGQLEWVQNATTGLIGDVASDAIAKMYLAVLKARRMLPIGSVAFPDFAISTAGDIYFTGSFRDPITVGGQTITSSGDRDIFIAKFNSNGDFQWIRRDGSPSREQSFSIALNPLGNIYVTGFFFSPSTLAGKTLTSEGTGTFIARYKD